MLLATSAIGLAQDYLGTYKAIPPPRYPADPNGKAAWATMTLRIEILPNKVTYTYGTPTPTQCDIIPAKEGEIPLAKNDHAQIGTMYVPIYLFDKDTIFTMGSKLVRAKDGKGIEEKDR